MGAMGNLHTFDSFFYPYNQANQRGGDTFYTSNPGGESLGAYNFVASNVWKLFMSATVPGIPYGQSVGYIYRFYSDSIVDHLFKFGSSLPSSAYVLEGIIGVAYTQNGAYRQPVYRFYNPSTGDHKYKTSSNTPSGYIYEGVAWYSPIPVYGCKDPNATNFNPYANQPSTGCTYIVYGCTDPNASNYNSSATNNDGSCTYPNPTVSLSLSPNSIIQGQSASLSWSTFNSTSQSITNIGGVASSGSLNVSPSSTTTYTLTGNYYGYTSASVSRTLTVYTPPSISFTVDDSEIVRLDTTILRWSVSGSVSTVTISPGIGSTNISSQAIISPTTTTTYTLSADGPGGAASATVTVTVIDPPSVSLNGPLAVSYGDNITLSHEMSRATASYLLYIQETDLDGNVTTPSVSPVDLGAGNSANASYTHLVTYHDRGPASIQYSLTGVGSGGLTDVDVVTVPINIDQTPNAIQIPASEDKLRDEAPVITPDTEVTTDQILIEEIDIPVEVKSDYPIQVEIENSGTYIEVREI